MVYCILPPFNFFSSRKPASYISNVLNHLLQREKHIFSVGIRTATQNMVDYSDISFGLPVAPSVSIQTVISDADRWATRRPHFFKFFSWHFKRKLISDMTEFFLHLIKHSPDLSKKKTYSQFSAEKTQKFQFETYFDLKVVDWFRIL